MKYFRKLIGEKCYLSPVSLEDVEKYTEWINDMEVGQFVLFSATVYDVEKEREALQNMMKNNILFAIVEKDTNKAIGNCGLHHVSEIHRKATFGIFIGDKSNWNQGIGTEATCLLLDYAFNIINLNNIMLEVVEFNKRAIKCYEKCGFRYIGIRRQAIFMAGRYHDVLIYDILASEFNSPYIKQLFEKSVSGESDKDKISIV